MGKANTCGSNINRTKDTLGVKGLATPGETVSKISIAKGKMFKTNNGGGRKGSANKYC